SLPPRVRYDPGNTAYAVPVPTTHLPPGGDQGVRTMTTELEAPARPIRKTPPPAEKKSTSSDRCLTLDAYRGLTMLLMVSSGLSMGHLLTANLPDSLPNRALLFAADQLRHREWDMTFGVNAGFPSWDSQGFHDGTGCTPWDLIQPSFMFIVGA